MRTTKILLAGAAAAAVMAGTALAEDPIGKGVTMYMQMGGNAGDGATLARARLTLGLHAPGALQLFLETMVDAIKERLNGDDATFPIFEGFDWRLSLRGLRSGLSDDEDWKFRWWLTLLLGEVLLGRFEQRVNS
jgi:hypothetical protein